MARMSLAGLLFHPFDNVALKTEILEISLFLIPCLCLELFLVPVLRGLSVCNEFSFSQAVNYERYLWCPRARYRETFESL